MTTSAAAAARSSPSSSRNAAAATVTSALGGASKQPTVHAATGVKADHGWPGRTRDAEAADLRAHLFSGRAARTTAYTANSFRTIFSTDVESSAEFPPLGTPAPGDKPTSRRTPPPVTPRPRGPAVPDPAADKKAHLYKKSNAKTRRGLRDVRMPTVSEAALQPLRAKYADGTATADELFDLAHAISPMYGREVVTHLRMDTSTVGVISETHALRQVLHGDDVPEAAEAFFDIVYVMYDPKAQELIWGLASFAAAAALEGKVFPIPTKKGSVDLMMTR